MGKDRRRIRSAGLNKAEVLTESGELALTFMDFSNGKSYGNRAVVIIDRYQVGELMVAVDKYKTTMIKHYENQIESVKRNCART